jgi:hypothetical protein
MSRHGRLLTIVETLGFPGDWLCSSIEVKCSANIQYSCLPRDWSEVKVCSPENCGTNGGILATIACRELAYDSSHLAVRVNDKLLGCSKPRGVLCATQDAAMQSTCG